MACLLRRLLSRRAIWMKRNMILKETIILITEAGLANWNEKHKGKKENGNREVPSLFSSWHLSAHCPILFHLTLVRRLNLNWKQYIMVLQKKGNTLENPKKSKNNQRYEQKQLISSMIKHKPLLQFQMVQLQPRVLWTKIDVKNN